MKLRGMLNFSINNHAGQLCRVLSKTEELSLSTVKTGDHVTEPTGLDKVRPKGKLLTLQG